MFINKNNKFLFYLLIGIFFRIIIMSYKNDLRLGYIVIWEFRVRFRIIFIFRNLIF